MTNRELFLNIMNYGHVDRMPVVHWAGWRETMERWYAEGLPREKDIHKIRNKLEHYGVKLYGIDSDGDVTALVKPWLDAGVNIQFPIEVPMARHAS
jgi:hypothetical protein